METYDWKKKKSYKPKNTLAKSTRYFKKHPDNIRDVMNAVLSRHGIQRQVMSAMLVTRANDMLKEALDMHVRPDVTVAWYRNKELFIACRVPAAIHVVSPLAEGLRRDLEAQFPDVTIERVTCRFHPASFENL